MANRAFIRFRNITIPNYSEVSDVFARLTAYSDRVGTPVNLRCAFVDEDNPEVPTSYDELQAYSLTSWVSWNLTNSWTDGQEYDTPDLTNILQLIIERTGWESGNSVILIIEDVDSIDNQMGFSSVQFDGGEEKSILFVDYLAREFFLSVDDDFVGDDDSIINPSLWYHWNNIYSEIPIIRDNQSYGQPLGTGSSNVCAAYSAWYTKPPMDIQIDWDARLFASTGYSKISMIVVRSTLNYKQNPGDTPSNYIVLADWNYVGSSTDYNGSPHDSFMEAGSKKIEPWTGNAFGKWRISFSVVGVEARVIFYLDGIVWHEETINYVNVDNNFSVFLQSTLYPEYGETSPAIFDNFILNTGNPIVKLETPE